MSRLTEGPDVNPPEDDYFESLTSEFYGDTCLKLQEALQATGDLDFISTWFLDPVLTLSDLEYPAITIAAENDSLAKGVSRQLTSNAQITIEYQCKHHLRLHMQELYYVAEKILSELRVNPRLGIECVQSIEIQGVEFSANFDEDFVISQVYIILLVKRAYIGGTI